MVLASLQLELQARAMTTSHVCPLGHCLTQGTSLQNYPSFLEFYEVCIL